PKAPRGFNHLDVENSRDLWLSSGYRETDALIIPKALQLSQELARTLLGRLVDLLDLGRMLDRRQEQVHGLREQTLGSEDQVVFIDQRLEPIVSDQAILVGPHALLGVGPRDLIV